jgi:hypothetical protein
VIKLLDLTHSSRTLYFRYYKLHPEKAKPQIVYWACSSDNESLLFSFLKNGECIGYGGLVHINWIDQNAEISFMID